MRVVSHDDWEGSTNPFLNRDPNYLYAEYGYMMDMPCKPNIVYFCREKEDNLWRSENIRNINARR